MRAKAFDALRGLLPAAATSNVGIYGSGQAYEALLMRMRAHPLPEARAYADLMLIELRKVIPSLVKRVDVAGPGRRPRRPTSRTTTGPCRTWPTASSATAGRPRDRAGAGDPEVTLLDWDPDAETKVVAAMLYPYTHLPEAAHPGPGGGHVGRGAPGDRLRNYAGDRTNRRHRPGRALERTDYRFDVLSDYGAFRDLQRHRLLTVEWQDLTPAHGYTMPRAVVDAGGSGRGYAGRHGALGGALRRPVASGSGRPRRPTPSPWPSGSATSCSSTPARRCT